jgi:4-alpha-glucanotransferase
MRRAAGVLLPVSSLPNSGPIGTFGREAFSFVDFLADCGFSFWQVLPLERFGNGDSPYDCRDAFAGELSYCTSSIQGNYGNRTFSPYQVDYEAAREFSAEATREQFETEWLELRKHANDKGIQLIGDLPFYVSESSKDVIEHPDWFNLNLTSGAPPDYFNPEGQSWGNPTYDWAAMRKSGYSWWCSRIERAMKMYDYVRLDHFRGFSKFWGISGAGTEAQSGKWYNGPGYPLFQAMEKRLGKLPIIAENLGDIDSAVRELLAKAGFPGMAVFQFGFTGERSERPANIHLPHNYRPNLAAYSGTHDNTTLLDWVMKLDDDSRWDLFAYLGYSGDFTRGGRDCTINKAILRSLFQSPSKLVIVPLQDILGYGADSRLNIPGTATGNWRWRVTQDGLNEIDRDYWKNQLRLFNRI